MVYRRGREGAVPDKHVDWTRNPHRVERKTMARFQSVLSRKALGHTCVRSWRAAGGGIFFGYSAGAGLSLREKAYLCAARRSWPAQVQTIYWQRSAISGHLGI